VILWLAGRAAVAVSGLIGEWPAALIDLSFLFTVAAVTLREIVSGRNWRNLPVVLAITLFLTANALTHAEAAGLFEMEGLARRFAIGVVIMMIALIGGRVIPSFTRNWLAKRGDQQLPKAFGRFDRLTLVATLIALVVWAVAPDNILSGGLNAVAAALNLYRLARWQGQATFSEPLVWVLHVAYLWIPIGLGLLALSYWWDAVSSTDALHALTAGAAGTMTLAVMSRATLGHTARALRAGVGLSAAYVLVTLAALVRIGSSLSGEFYLPALTVAAVAWITAFVLFLCICGPMLVTRRPDRGEE
jgi:uncharacterized protein involved in response to NO